MKHQVLQRCIIRKSTTDLAKFDLKEWVPRDEWPKTKTFGRDVQGQIPSGRSQNQDERPDTNSILKSFARSSWKICVTWGYTKRRSWTYVGWRAINIELLMLLGFVCESLPLSLELGSWPVAFICCFAFAGPFKFVSSLSLCSSPLDIYVRDVHHHVPFPLTPFLSLSIAVEDISWWAHPMYDMLRYPTKCLCLIQVILQHQSNINLHRCSDKCQHLGETISNASCATISLTSRWLIESTGTAATCAWHPHKVLDEIPDASSMDILKAS